MLKPSGLFVYEITALAGAGGAITKSLLSDADAKGDLIDPAKVKDPVAEPLVYWMEAYFVVEALGAATSNAGRCRVEKNVVVVNGELTSLDATLTNNSPGAGDTVTGTLYVRVNHFENLAT